MSGSHRSAPPSTSARDVVTKRTAARARQFPRLSIHPLDTSGLDDRDAALALAIDQALLRRWLSLVTVVERVLDRPFERLQAQVKAALLVGAAQLLLLDRLPDHAVINEAVQWTRSARPRAAGLVNAVLRRVAALRGEIVDTPAAPGRDVLPLHDGRAWRLRREVFPADPLRRLAGQTSHPEGLLRHWHATAGADVARARAMHSLVHPPVIVAGAPPGPGLRPHEQAGFAVFEGSRRELTALLEARPEARVQDPAAAAAVQMTASMSPATIVDVCAGRGTKTRQLAALHPEARIVASDVHAGRLDDLRRLAATDPRIEAVPPLELARWRGRADLLLLDVPCSNTGTLARRLEARYRFDAVTLAELVSLQRQIVADALPLLGGSGTLVYSTCSLEAEENREQARWIARWHPLRVETMGAREPRGAPGDAPDRYADGGFAACLRRASRATSL